MSYFLSATKRRAFTLIELLIVVAIIAILAAIAVPNFLEAQTRAKVSRVVADLRSYDTGVGMYHIDHNKFPPTLRLVGQTRTWMSHYLTTPVSYINGAFPDVFNQVDPDGEDRVIVAWGPDYNVPTPSAESRSAIVFKNFPNYSDGTNMLRKKFFYMFSLGPDRKYDISDPVFASPVDIYDASNGTISRGDIGRFNG